MERRNDGPRRAWDLIFCVAWRGKIMQTGDALGNWKLSGMCVCVLWSTGCLAQLEEVARKVR